MRCLGILYYLPTFMDKIRFESVINTKSKSTIRWNETVDIIKRIKQKINEGSINEILGKFDNTIISTNMKKLIKIFILERKAKYLAYII